MKIQAFAFLTQLIPKKLHVATFLLLITCMISCKKEKEEPPNNNEFNATVVLSNSETHPIQAAGSKALLGCSLWGGGTFVDGTNENGEAVYMTIYDANLSCVATAGTYSFRCEYRKNVNDQTAPIYTNNSANDGRITFTSISNNYMEGSFNAVCYCNSLGCIPGVDSVLVTGTFKGDHLN